MYQMEGKIILVPSHTFSTRIAYMQVHGCTCHFEVMSVFDGEVVTRITLQNIKNLKCKPSRVNNSYFIFIFRVTILIIQRQ